VKLETRPVSPDLVPELGRICYQAFKDISDRHGFPSDFPSESLATTIIGSLVHGEEVYGVAAFVDGRPAGSGFLSTPDEVGSVGPVSVDVGQQGAGIGRMMMADLLEYAGGSGIEMVRLMQDSFNMMSLALYASLGFETKAPCALMEPPSDSRPDASIRAVTGDDLPVIEQLSRELYKVSRRNEVARFLERGPFRPLIRERKGSPVGYFVLGLAGHGVAYTEADAVALVLEAARQSPPQLRRFLCPLIKGSLYRRLLAAGCRNVKVMNLMVMGPYQQPEGSWLPSVGY
jgi:GNAT superfamily N-acetyltransferase